MSDRKPAPTAFADADAELEARRKQTLAQLESLHGTRAIGAEEYRRRAEVARRAQDEAELESVRPTADEGRTRPPSQAAPRTPAVPAEPRTPATPAAPPSLAPAPARGRSASVPIGDETGYAIAVLGGATRTGPWEPPERLYAFALMGGVDLDFRQAALLEGVTEVHVLAIMGGAKIIVPEDVDVEVNGFGFMGGFDHVSHHGAGEDRPLIRIKGFALMGGVEVKVKAQPGQTTMDRLKKRVRDLV